MRKNEKSLVLACGLNPNRGSSLLTVLENPEGGSEKCDQVPTSARIRNHKTRSLWRSKNRKTRSLWRMMEERENENENLVQNLELRMENRDMRA